MSDLICHVPNHGYSDTDVVFVSWLGDIRFVSDKAQDSFKLATESGGSTLEQFTESITDGFVRESSTSSTTTITGLDHLEGESVHVTSDGSFLGLFTVSGGSITLTGAVINYAVGLPVTSTLIPMKLDLEGLGLSVTKKINRGIFSFDNTVGGEVGTTSADTKPMINETGTSLFSGDIEIPLDGGYSRAGDIIVRQTEPLPMTILALTLDVGSSND